MLSVETPPPPVARPRPNRPGVQPQRGHQP
jgi:hypothetical protein